MAHYVCTCGVDHPTSEGRAICEMEHGPNSCQALGCNMQDDPVEVCRDHRCPHRWQREAGRGDSTANTSEVTSKWNTLATNSEDRKG